MIGLQQIRDDAEAVKAAVNRKGGGAEPLEAIDRILAADGRRRAVEAEVNDLRARAQRRQQAARRARCATAVATRPSG